MKSSLPMVKAIALTRPRGAPRFDAFSPKLQRRLTFCRRSVLEMWMLLETVRSLNSDALSIRRVGPAELAAARVWIDN